ncbi:MAG: TIGR02147 family protein [Proteobacteria bacterium]|nr:MAG: TIGR02147 family protein [Pseudomonadota bacterium]
MTQLLLYSFQDYREFLTVALAERGRRKALCDFVPCQTTFFSNVMKGGANLSLEHSIRVCEFLGLSDKESHYFMLLVHLGKAGSEELRDYFRKQIRGVQKEQEQIRSQISEHDTVPLQQQLMLYRSWIYVAIHILCAVPEFASRRAIREHLKLPATEIEPAIDFLIRIGVLKESRGQLKLGSTRIHLPKDSPFLQKHHYTP